MLNAARCLGSVKSVSFKSFDLQTPQGMRNCSTSVTAGHSWSTLFSSRTLPQLLHVQCATDVFSDELRTELKSLGKPIEAYRGGTASVMFFTNAMSVVIDY